MIIAQSSFMPLEKSVVSCMAFFLLLFFAPSLSCGDLFFDQPHLHRLPYRLRPRSGPEELVQRSNVQRYRAWV